MTLNFTLSFGYSFCTCKTDNQEERILGVPKSENKNHKQIVKCQE